MSLKTLNYLQIVIGICIAGILASFAMSVVTARRIHHEEVRVNPAAIPVPAVPAPH